MLQDVYARYSNNSQPFALPQFANETYVVLPPGKMKALLQNPDDEVSFHIVLKDMLAAQYTGDLDIGAAPCHLDIVRHELTRKLPTLTAAIYSELLLGFEDQWRADSEDWNSVRLFGTCANIVSRGANRVFSGEVLCRKEGFLTHTRQYAQQISAGSDMLNMLPRFLRPVFGPLIAWNNREHVRVCVKYAGPIIEERLAAIRAGNKDPPNDALQWLVERCIARNDPAELNINRITSRLIRLNMVAIHTTSITTTNALLDLYTSPNSAKFLAGEREECSRVLAAHGGQWTKAAVNELYRIDSAIKESMRMSSIQLHGMVHEVTAPEGIDLGDGIHIPHGVRIAMPNVPIHRDADFYPNNPNEYDAFRFSRNREKFDAEGQVLDKRNQGLATTSDTFLSFGHGKHACPGRCFAGQELKLMLAIIVSTYNVKIEGPRPRNLEIKGGSIPDGKAEVLVRLRGER